MKEYAPYALVLLIVVAAMFVMTSGAAPSFSFDGWMANLPATIIQVLLICLLAGLLYFGWMFGNRYYRDWRRTQHRSRGRRDQQVAAQPRGSRLTLDQLYKGWMMQQMGIHRSQKPPRNRVGW